MYKNIKQLTYRVFVLEYHRDPLQGTPPVLRNDIFRGSKHDHF